MRSFQNDQTLLSTDVLELVIALLPVGTDVAFHLRDYCLLGHIMQHLDVIDFAIATEEQWHTLSMLLVIHRSWQYDMAVRIV